MHILFWNQNKYHQIQSLLSTTTIHPPNVFYIIHSEQNRAMKQKTSLATIESGRPSLSLSSMNGLFSIWFKSSCSKSSRMDKNSWQSCCDRSANTEPADLIASWERLPFFWSFFLPFLIFQNVCLITKISFALKK